MSARELAERVIRDNGPADISDEGKLARALLASEEALRGVAATYVRWSETTGEVAWQDVAAKMAYAARSSLSSGDATRPTGGEA